MVEPPASQFRSAASLPLVVLLSTPRRPHQRLCSPNPADTLERSALEFGEKLLATNLTSTDTTEREAISPKSVDAIAPGETPPEWN
jgi:hypothetical protein